MRTLDQLNTKVGDIVYFCGIINYRVVDKAYGAYYLSPMERGDSQMWATSGNTNVWTKEQDTYELCAY